MEINEQFWWESLDEHIISEIKRFDSDLDEYYGHLQILFIDEYGLQKRRAISCRAQR